MKQGKKQIEDTEGSRNPMDRLYTSPPERAYPKNKESGQVDCSEMTVGDRVHYVRHLRHLTQTELARNAGLTQAAICSLEGNLLTPGAEDEARTIRRPRGATLIQIAEALGVGSEWLMNGVGLMEASKTVSKKSMLTVNEYRAQSLFVKLTPQRQQEAIRYIEYLGTH